MAAKENTKDLLMKTAIELWKTKGYDAVSIPAICERCGVTKGSFYHHFESKDDLLLQYYIQCGAANSQRVFQQMILVPSYIEKLSILFCSFSAISKDLGPDLTIRLIYADLLRKGGLFIVGNEETAAEEQLHVSICRQGQEAGEIRSDVPARKLMEVAEEAVTGFGFLWSAGDREQDSDTQVREILRIILQK